MIACGYSSGDDQQTKEFLRNCLNVGRHSAALDRARELSSQIDWMAVQIAASEQFVSPLLYKKLKGTGILPSELEMELQSAYQETGQRNLTQAAALRNLLTLFRSYQIEAILLKGLSLAVDVYANIAARPSRDIDLLIQPKNIPQALKHARTLGYEPIKVTEHPGTAIQFENEISLYHPDRRIFLELHWSLFDSPFYQRKLDMGWFWRNTAQMDIARSPVRIFTPESNLLYLCGHMVLHHHGDELLWLNDITELILRRQDNIRWEFILEKAQDFHLVLPVRYVLLQIAMDWYAPIPQDVLETLQNFPVTEEEIRVFNHLAGKMQTSGQHFWSDLMHINGWGNRLNYAVQLLFPSFLYMRQRYGIERPILVPLYYPYRWWLGVHSYFMGRKNQ